MTKLLKQLCGTKKARLSSSTNPDRVSDAALIALIVTAGAKVTGTRLNTGWTRPAA
jgi:hypothetical protein